MGEIVIRPYRPEDRPAVREIAWNTAFMGKPADAFFSDKALLQDFLTKYFTDYEPWSCFVAESNGSVVGYLIGAENEKRIGVVSLKMFVPGLLLRFVFRDLFRTKDRRFIAAALRGAMMGEFRGEHFSGPYPAVLHINLTEEARGKGAGGRLIRAFLDRLRARGVKGVHCATMSRQSGVFFEKQGFTLLSCHTRSYFKHITGRLTEVRVYGRALP